MMALCLNQDQFEVVRPLQGTFAFHRLKHQGIHKPAVKSGTPYSTMCISLMFLSRATDYESLMRRGGTVQS